MARRSKLVLQAAAVSVVALLIGLLAWQVFRTDQGRALGAKVNKGERPLAPQFMLDRLDGKGKLSLASLRGKVVVLNFWASWCEPCKAESPRLESFWQQNRHRGVVVLGIDAQDFDFDANRFVDRYKLSYPILRDKHGSTLGHYGISGFPETWFVDRRGRLVGKHIEGPVSQADLERYVQMAMQS
jgi:cytochrome c biogenesis protein CcmG, thiol:disulfide interchange protein DsbE